MSRPLRIHYPGAYYHVMNRGRGRQKIYWGFQDYQRFLELLEETCQMWGLKVYAYCLMPNHYHLLVETPEGNLSRCMRHLDGIYTQRYNRAHKTDGSLFRGRYKAILIDEESYLMQLVRYIHLNPVEGKLVEKPEGYRWSSHRHYLGKGKKIRGMITDTVLKRFHGNTKMAKEIYKKYMKEGVDEQTQRLYKRGNWPSIWGSEKFKEEIETQLSKKKTEYEIPQMKQERRGIGLEEIEDRVCRSYGIEKEKLTKKRQGPWSEARNVAIYLSRKLGGVKLGEIGERWGGLSYSSVSGIMYAVKEKMEQKKGFRKKVEEIVSFLNRNP